MILVHFQENHFTYSNPGLHSNHYAKEADVDGFSEDLQHFLELTHMHTHTKWCPFYQRILEWKVESQELPWITVKFGLGVQNEAGQRLRVLSREHAGHNIYPFPAIQKTTLHMNLIKCSILYQIDYGLCSWSWRSFNS